MCFFSFHLLDAAILCFENKRMRTYCRLSRSEMQWSALYIYLSVIFPSVVESAVENVHSDSKDISN